MDLHTNFQSFFVSILVNKANNMNVIVKGSNKNLALIYDRGTKSKFIVEFSLYSYVWFLGY